MIEICVAENHFIKGKIDILMEFYFWCLWTKRNKKCFDEISTSRDLLRGRCLVSLFSWSKLTPGNNLKLFWILLAL